MRLCGYPTRTPRMLKEEEGSNMPVDEVNYAKLRKNFNVQKDEDGERTLSLLIFLTVDAILHLLFLILYPVAAASHLGTRRM